MRTTMISALLALCLMSLPACQSTRGAGAGVGAGFGAGIGAAVDDDNPWRGALIGGALGGILGYAVGDTIERERETAARDAYYEDRPVVREFENDHCGDRYRVEAEPVRGERERVVTTVWREDRETGEWVVVSEEAQDIP